MKVLFTIRSLVVVALALVTLPLGSTIFNLTVKQINTPDSRPCLFVNMSNGQWYSIPINRGDYNEARTFLLTAFALKTTVHLNIVPGNPACAPHDEILTFSLVSQ